MNKQQVLAGTLALTLSTVALANDTGVDEDSLFGGSDDTSEEALFGSEEDEGDLFGDGLLSESAEGGADLAEEFLAGTDPFLLNGDFTLSATTTRKDYTASGKTTSDVVKAEGTVTMDVRPSASLRGLVKADYSIDQDTSDTSVREAFVDWTIAEQWYLRAGKQVMHWGVGRFYSPADLINSNSIDAADPDADRDGTDALKVHYPTGNDNYYVYLVPQTGSSNNAVGLKGEWLISENEMSLASVSRPNGHNSFAMTYYVPSNDLNLFAEYVLHHGVTTLAMDANGNTSDRSDKWLSQSTLGVTYNLADDDDYNISVTAQYFDNGLGYDTALWQTQSSAWKAANVEKEFYGSHYSAVSLRWANIMQSDYTLNLSSLTNMTDDSRTNKASLSYKYSDDVKGTFTYSKASGVTGGQYSRSGSGDSVSFKLTMLSREF